MHPKIGGDLALAGEPARASANPACYDCNPNKFCLSVSRRIANLDRSNTHSGSSEFDYGAIPMSNISAKFAFALLVVFASLAASFARHGGLAATRNMPTTIGSSGAGKCIQGSRATGAERAEFVHSDGVCRAPQNTID